MDEYNEDVEDAIVDDAADVVVDDTAVAKDDDDTDDDVAAVAVAGRRSLRRGPCQGGCNFCFFSSLPWGFIVAVVRERERESKAREDET